MSRTLICLLSAAFLAVSSGLTIARAAGDPGIATPAMDLLDRAHRKLAEGDSPGARADLMAAVEQLTGTGQLEQIVGALVTLASLEQDEGRSRQAMNWWLRALPPARFVRCFARCFVRLPAPTLCGKKPVHKLPFEKRFVRALCGNAAFHVFLNVFFVC